MHALAVSDLRIGCGPQVKHVRKVRLHVRVTKVGYVGEPGPLILLSP
jgi:hypothetical protein